jgi:hypothetical protein
MTLVTRYAKGVMVVLMVVTSEMFFWRESGV